MSATPIVESVSRLIKKIEDDSISSYENRLIELTKENRSIKDEMQMVLLQLHQASEELQRYANINETLEEQFKRSQIQVQHLFGMLISQNNA